MRVVSVKEFDRLLCDVVDRGWRTYYHKVLQAYVVVRPLPHVGNNGEFFVDVEDMWNSTLYEHVRASVRVSHKKEP